MHILVCAQFAPPEIGAAPTRLLEHASRWVDAGHRVTVITNVPNSPFGRIYPGYDRRGRRRETIAGIEFRRTRTIPAGKGASLPRRAISLLAYVLGSCWHALRVPRPDLVLATAPYLAGVPGLFAARIHRVPFLYEMRDPWIQVAAANRAISPTGLLYRGLSALEGWIARSARRVIVIGDVMADHVMHELRLEQRPAVVANGIVPAADTDREPPRCPEKWPVPARQPAIGFFGNMGSQYDLNVVIAAAARLRDECSFLFMGEGAQKAGLEQASARQGLSNVFFLGAVSKEAATEWLRCCTLTIVPMRADPIFRLYLPLKLLESLSKRVPVVFGGSGESERVLVESGGGFVFPAGDVDELTRIISDALRNPDDLAARGAAGARYVRQEFTRDRAAAKLLLIAQEVCEGEVSTRSLRARVT